MAYVENNLGRGEVIVDRIEHSKLALIAIIFISAIFVAMAIVCFNLGNIVSNALENTLNKKVESENSEIAQEILLHMDVIGSTLKIIGIIIGAIIMVITILVASVDIVEIFCAQLVITNKRILGRRGFISKQTTDILISKVETISVGNSFWGAIFKYGKIKIITAGSGSMTAEEKGALSYSYIRNCIEFKKSVLAAIDRVKEEDAKKQAAALAEAMARK